MILRPEDVHECIEKWDLFYGLSVFDTLADLAMNSRWNLTDPTTFSQLLEMAEAHLDATGGDEALSRCYARLRRNGGGKSQQIKQAPEQTKNPSNPAH